MKYYNQVSCATMPMALLVCTRRALLARKNRGWLQGRMYKIYPRWDPLWISLRRMVKDA